MAVEFKNNEQLDSEANSEEGAIDGKAKDREVVLSNLSAYLSTRWETAKKSKVGAENQFMSNLRARRREYSPEMIAALQQMFGKDYEPVYAPITETKCSAAEAWIKELYFQKGEKPWELEPTPIPELPDSIMEVVEYNVRIALDMQAQAEAQAGMGAPTQDMFEQTVEMFMPEATKKVSKVIDDLAKESAEKISKKIEDMFVEGGWDKALSECIYDVVTFGTMIMKGPFLEREVVRRREFDPATGRWLPKLEERLKEKWARVNPFDFYPLPGTTCTQSGDFFELVRLTRKDFSDMLDVEGWDQDAVRAVLRAYRSGGHVEWKTTDQERILLEGKESSDLNDSEDIECLKFHGSAPGQMLLDFGMGKDEIEDAEREYDVVAWVVGPYIIKASINPDPLGARPYFTAGFREVPDSFWHVGVPGLCESAQKLGNAIFRSIAINVAISSGPQIEVDTDRLAPGEQYRIWPFRVWKSTNQQLADGQAVNFFQPQIVTGPLMDVFELTLKMADEDTGVPRYAHGDPQVGGAGETASGLSMLMSQSAKGIKMVVKNIDDGPVAGSVEYSYNYILQYEDDIDAVGDLRAVATGSYALMAREQQAIRRTEFLVQTANEFDNAILGTGGRKELLRQALKALDIDPDKVIKDEAALDQMALGVPPNNPAGQIGAGALTPDGITPGAPPPAPAALNEAGAPVAGADTALFNSAPGITP